MKQKCTKFRGNIQRQVDAHTHSHMMVADHTKGSLQRSLMQVALSIFSPTSATRKIKRQLIPLLSHWELPSPRQPVQQPANGGCSMAWRTRCLTTSSLGSAGGLGLSEDTTPCRQAVPRDDVLPWQFHPKSRLISPSECHNNMHIWLFGSQARVSTPLGRCISSLGESSGSLAQPAATQ